MLKIGWAEQSITPDKKIFLDGQFAERISEYVEKPLTVTALAVEGEQDYFILVSADLEGIGSDLVDTVREKLTADKVDFDPMKVIYCATHTHTGPTYPKQSRTRTGGIPKLREILIHELPAGKRYAPKAEAKQDPNVCTGEEVFAFLAERFAEVAAAAWNGRKEGGYANAFGRVPVGMCRRVSYADGSAQMWGDTNTANFAQLEGGNDSGMELLYMFDGENQLTGIVANIACPAQCVQHRKFVSPDYWGEAKMLLRKHFGEHIYLLPLCSAAGDQCPVDLVRWVEPESDVNDPNLIRNNPPARKADPSMFDLSGMRKTGKRVAREIVDVFEEGVGPVQTMGDVVHKVENMQLPIRRVSQKDADGARAAIRQYLENIGDVVDYNDVARLQVHLGTLERLELQDTLNVLDTEVHIIKMGPVVFATNPFELFLDYGNQIRARALAQQTFLVQMANGEEGYLPTEKAEQGGHYSAFVSSGYVGHQGGDQLVRQTLTEINKLFTAKG